MHALYPGPRDVGIRIPSHLREARFCRGFRHALQGGQITRAEQLKLSFVKAIVVENCTCATCVGIRALFSSRCARGCA